MQLCIPRPETWANPWHSRAAGVVFESKAIPYALSNPMTSQSSILDTWLERRPPEPLFHHTSASALVSILEKRAVAYKCQLPE